MIPRRRPSRRETPTRPPRTDVIVAGCRIKLGVGAHLLDPPFELYRSPADAAVRPDFVLDVQEAPDVLPDGADAVAPLGVRRRAGRITARGAGYRVELEPAAGDGRARIAPGSRFHRVLLQLALAEWLAPRGGLLVHGCGLAAGGRGWLFIGPSGAGKSTVAELAGPPVLSDETCVVRLAPAGGVALAGTPIGIGTAAGPVPLAGILWLEQAPADELRPLDPGQALARFMTQVVAAGRQDAELAPLLETAATVLDRIPMQTLRFTRSRRFVDMLELDAEA